MCRTSPDVRGRTEHAKTVVDLRKRGPIGHDRLCKNTWWFQRRHSHLIQDQDSYKWLLLTAAATAPSDGCYSSVSILTRLDADAEVFTEYSVGLRTALTPLAPSFILSITLQGALQPYDSHCWGARMSGPSQSCSRIVNLLQSGI